MSFMSRSELDELFGGSIDYENDEEEGEEEEGYVGEGPGDQWMQVPTTQEKKQGYKKTDVMTLRVNADTLRDSAQKLVDDSGGDPEATDLLGKATILAQQVAALAQQGVGNYPALAQMYQQLLGTYQDILSRAVAVEPETPQTAPASTAHHPVASPAAHAPPPAPMPAFVPAVRAPVPPPVDKWAKVKKYGPWTVAALGLVMIATGVKQSR